MNAPNAGDLLQALNNVKVSHGDCDAGALTTHKTAFAFKDSGKPRSLIRGHLNWLGGTPLAQRTQN